MTKPPGRPAALRALVAERRTKLLELKSTGWSHQRIVNDAGLGYRDKAHVSKDLARTLDQHRAATQMGADDYRALELAKLDEQEAILWDIVRDGHPVVQGGKIVADVEDVGPVLGALDRILRIAQQRAKLLGLEAPMRIDAGGTVAFTFPGVDMAKAFPPADTEGAA
jgi:hypothetical protein